MRRHENTIERTDVKGIGCPLLISINIVIFDQGKEKIKKKKNDQTGTQARTEAITKSLAVTWPSKI